MFGDDVDPLTFPRLSLLLRHASLSRLDQLVSIGLGGLFMVTVCFLEDVFGVLAFTCTLPGSVFELNLCVFEELVGWFPLHVDKLKRSSRCLRFLYTLEPGHD